MEPGKYDRSELSIARFKHSHAQNKTFRMQQKLQQAIAEQAAWAAEVAKLEGQEEGEAGGIRKHAQKP